MPDLSQRPRAKVDSARLPKRDLYAEGLAEVRQMTGALPPAPVSRRREVARPAKDHEPEEIDFSELFEVRDNDTAIPTREEIPELPLYGDEIEGMVDAAIARSTPSTPPQRSLRTATLPPPPPAFNSTRGNTLPGYPPPFPAAEARTSYPEASREDSGRRPKITEVATADHVREAANGTSAEIHRLKEEIKQHISAELTSLRQAPTPFKAPPSRTSWLASIGRGAVEKVKGWWGSLTAGSTKETKQPKEEPGLGEMLRVLERAEEDARDLPTAFLTGSLQRSNLQASKDRWERTVDDLQTRPPSKTAIVEQRRSAVTGQKGLALQALLESDRATLTAELPSECRQDMQTIQDHLPQHIHMLNALRVSRDEGKKTAAEQALQELKRVVGGVSINDFVARTIRTCEAAARLPLAEVDNGVRKTLSDEYTQRLDRIQKALGLRTDLKQALLNIKGYLSAPISRTDWKRTGTRG